MLILTTDCSISALRQRRFNKIMSDDIGTKCIFAPHCTGVVETIDYSGERILVFTTAYELLRDERKELEQFLADETGLNCRIADMCTGVFYISEECPD